MATVWTKTLDVSPAAPPAFDELRLYLPLETGDLVALNLTSGETAWQIPLPTKLEPAASHGRVIVAGDRVLDAVSVADGVSLWRVALDAAAVQAPTLRAGWIFLPLATHDLDAYNAETGTRVWRAPLNGAPTTTVTIEGDRIYVGAEGQRLIALDVTSGAQLWNTRLDGDITAIAAIGDRLFAGTKARHLHALDPRSGRSRWRWRIGGDVLGFAVNGNDVIALMLDQSMRAFRMGNGAQIWREELAFRPFAGPLLTGSDLLITGHGPTIRMHDADGGKRRGTYGIPASAGVEGEATFEALVAGPHVHDVAGVVDDLVILVTQRGTVHAARRQLSPPIAPITALPGTPLPVPSLPDPTAPPAPPSPQD